MKQTMKRIKLKKKAQAVIIIKVATIILRKLRKNKLWLFLVARKRIHPRCSIIGT